MHVDKITTIYFSPTNSTQHIMQGIAADLHADAEFDLTPHVQPDLPSFSATDLLIVGFPVYGGRVPQIFLQHLEAVHGHKTPLVLVATYGNRAYDDALLEAQLTLAEQGFKAVAAAAFIAEHSIVHEVASGRPDQYDWDTIHKFAARTLEKVHNIEDLDLEEELIVKGNLPYCQPSPLPLAPHATDQCTHCGACARACPTGAIPTYNPAIIDKKLCICCMRCVKICPLGARKPPLLAMQMAKKMLLSKCQEPKEPELFF